MAIIIHETIFSIIIKLLFILFAIFMIKFIYNNKYSKYHQTSNAIYLMSYLTLTIATILVGILPILAWFILISFSITFMILAHFVTTTVERQFFVYQLYNKGYKEFHKKVHEMIKEDKKKKKK